MTYLRKLTAIILIWIPLLVFADNDPYIQYLPEYQPQSPHAQAMARSIDIPVNHYSGMPDISIPIYNIRAGSLSVPISLSYQGGGIKPCQESTSVGLGWLLNAGGAITRTLKCADDFMEHHASDCQFVYGFFDRPNWPRLDIIDGDYYRSIASQGSFGTVNRTYYLCADSEPDIFFYSIPGCSGKFSFKKDKSIVYFDKSRNVKINPSWGNTPRPYFYAIDSKGTAYCFEAKERTHIYSAQGHQKVNTTPTGVDVTYSGSNKINLKEVSDYTSTWFLTMMISATNDTVEFEYCDEDYQLPLQENCRYQKTVSGPYGDGPIYSASKTEIESKRLTKIRWKEGYVEFKYRGPREDLVRSSTHTVVDSDTPKYLEEITVYNNCGRIISRWKMSYSYFDSSLPDIPAHLKHLFKRLRLDSVRDLLVEQDPYTFHYYDSAAMPLKNTRNLDGWGYYNGTSQGAQYYFKSNYIAAGTDKYPNERYCKIGILENIDTPTGGTIKLHWESNKHNEPAGRSVRGGLRIGRIEGEKDVTYIYEDGKELIPPCTHYKEKHIYDNNAAEFEVWPSESVRPLSTLKGGTVIGYSKVTEKFADGSRNEYVFHNEEEVLEDPDFPYSPSLADWKNGVLLSTERYDAIGSLVSKTINSYSQVVTEENYKAGFMEIRPGYFLNYFNTVICPLLSHSTDVEYRGNGEYKVKHAYVYNDNLLCREERHQIGSDIKTTIYKYADDFQDAVSKKMVGVNMIGIPVVRLSLRNGVIYEGTRSIYGVFKELSNNVIINGSHGWDNSKFCEMYLPTHLLSVNTSNAASDYSTCRFDTVIIYNSYTRYGNVCELEYKGMPITYAWSYGGSYPVAELKNLKYGQFTSRLGLANLETTKGVYEDPEFLRDKIWNTTQKYDNVSAGIFFYEPLVGATSITDSHGVFHIYDYDRAGRLILERQSNIIMNSPEQIQSCSYGKNTVRSTVFHTTSTNNGVCSVQYYDKWGRPSVMAAQGINPDGTYSYSMQTYDRRGRVSQEYIPVPRAGNNGESIDTTAFKSLSASAFSNDSFGYTQNYYDILDRKVCATVPGKSWHDNGKSTYYEYLTNTDSEVRKYTLSGSSVTQQGYYPAGILDCTVTTNPDGITLKSYKDVFGNVILERRGDNLDTYFVYDTFNRLRVVLPPKYQDESNLDYYAYRYEYDGKGRTVKKTLPGCSPVQYWYDSADRLVKMQDGELAKSAKYRIWQYDGLGRQISQGIESLDGTVDYETRSFYDNYDFVSSYTSVIPPLAGSLIANLGTCHPTGFWQRTGNGEEFLSVYGYNEFGFLVKEMKSCIGGRLSVTDYETNLAGDVISESFNIYKKATDASAGKLVSGIVDHQYDYPHTRLLKSSVLRLFDGGGNVLRIDTIQSLTYDAFGNMINNDRGGVFSDMSYEYDVMHGWLTGIKSGSGFGQNLYRETEGSIPRWDGSLSAMSWKTDNGHLRRFDYTYDAMHRLTRADFSHYSISSSPGLDPVLSLIPYVGMEYEDYTSEYYYDKNGNILGAYRQGLVDYYDEGLYYDTLDDYYINYRGNQKIAVESTGVGNPSYFDGSYFVDGVYDSGTNEYSYNANGAMTMDLNRGISSIDYDLLGNIRKITLSGGTVDYVYSADGTRQRTVRSIRRGNAVLKDSTDYCGNLLLKNGAPYIYRFPSGYIYFSDGMPSGCHYYIEDYLGNVRMVVDSNNKKEQVTHYYPYGGVIGGIAQNAQLQPYKFGGNEFERTCGLDWYDIHARQYDPIVPSWNKIDPLAEEYYHMSPYIYCGDDPVNAIDPDGRSIWTKIVKIGAKVGARVSRYGWKELGNAATYADAVSDITDNVNTLFDGNASTMDKVVAGASLASEFLPVSAGDIKDAGKVVKAVHGNSKANTKAQHAYDIIDKRTNLRVKTGVSGGKVRKDGKSYRAEQQVRKWNKEEGGDFYESQITHTEPAGEGARDRILKYEKDRADYLRQQGLLKKSPKHQRP